MAENPIGIGKLLKKLNNLEGMKVAIRALKAGAVHVKGKVDVYPPATFANSPSQKRWYERGYGPRWRRKDGSIGGRKTSETLGRKWTTSQRNSGLTQIVGNRVSYGKYVQGEDDQTSFHRARGWLTDEKVIEQEADKILGLVKKEIDKALSS